MLPLYYPSLCKDPLSTEFAYKYVYGIFHILDEETHAKTGTSACKQKLAINPLTGQCRRYPMLKICSESANISVTTEYLTFILSVRFVLIDDRFPRFRHVR